jgi:predicted CXXCH cytochrome family protein
LKQLLILQIVILFFFSCDRGSEEKPTLQIQDNSSNYVGRQVCKECHLKQYELFIGSDHDLAMDEASAETVLGNFNNHAFEHHGVTSRFYKRKKEFYVNTEGGDGALQEFKIKYVFGIRPLQQYVVEFPNGRFQMLPICWDTRLLKDGGQRWFHIYDQEHIPHNDQLHWTRMAHNWNYMCSECHSTNVKKQYDYKREMYSTTWSEIDVSCEACHGPGSEHVDWAEAAENGLKSNVRGYLGLAMRLKDADNATWILRDTKKGTAERTSPRTNRQLVDMCGRCHARRSIISEHFVHGKSLLDTHHPSFLQESLYFSDGQIQDEVYVFGSFLQSKMYTAGVVCSDCHEPHSGKVFVDGNALCYRCHAPSKFGVRQHHFHDPEKTGGLCVECHMPERTYMVIDPRRDHSMRNPRPDLSDKLETPNACIKCHADKSNRWAAGYTKKWYGDKKAMHFGEVFHAARRAAPEALPNLLSLADSSTLSPMLRATALSLLENYSFSELQPLLQRALNDADPLIRTAAVSASRVIEPSDRYHLLKRALKDSVRLVRTHAAIFLADTLITKMSREDKYVLQAAVDEYKESLLINADHHTAWLNLALLALRQNDVQQAEANYKKAIEIEPLFPYSYINLADLYRVQDREAESERTLLDALDQNSGMADIHHALGLLFVRGRKLARALDYLQTAVRLSPETTRFSYVYGVALNSHGETDKALSVLQQALDLHPINVELLTSLATISRDNGDINRALLYAERLANIYPENKSFQHLLQQLTSLMSSE